MESKDLNTLKIQKLSWNREYFLNNTKNLQSIKNKTNISETILKLRKSEKDTDVYNGLLDSEGEGEGGMIWENGNSNMYTVM